MSVYSPDRLPLRFTRQVTYMPEDESPFRTWKEQCSDWGVVFEVDSDGLVGCELIQKVVKDDGAVRWVNSYDEDCSEPTDLIVVVPLGDEVRNALKKLVGFEAWSVEYITTPQQEAHDGA